MYHLLTKNRLHRLIGSESKQVSKLECIIKNNFSYVSTKTYVVGTQKNRLSKNRLTETVLLSTPNKC